MLPSQLTIFWRFQYYIRIYLLGIIALQFPPMESVSANAPYPISPLTAVYTLSSSNNRKVACHISSSDACKLRMLATQYSIITAW